MTNAEVVGALRTVRAFAARTHSPVYVARLLFKLGVRAVDEASAAEAERVNVLHQFKQQGSAAQNAVLAQLDGASGKIADAAAILKIGTQYGALLSGKAVPTDAAILAAITASGKP